MSLCSWAVSVTITTAPQGDLGHFCHCTDCQSNCGAPCVAYGIFADTAVSYSGAENLRLFQSSQKAMRYRCKVCNVLCRLHHPGRRLSYIPLAMLGVVPPVPSFHQYYTSRMMDFEDGAVKYEKEKGGKAVTAPIMLTDHME